MLKRILRKLLTLKPNLHNKSGNRETLQRTKKVVSDSPGLVDFAIGLVDFAIWLVNSVFNLPDGQVIFL